MSSSRMSISMRASTGESGMRVLPEMFKHRLHQLAEETVDSLQKIWKEAGYEEVECQRLLGDLLNKMKITCASELAAEQQILEHAKLEVESTTAEYTKLVSQLGRVPQIDHLTRMNYTDKFAELERLISDISVEVSQRHKMMNNELSDIKTMVDSLGEEFPDMEIFKGPEGTPELSDVRLNAMKQYKVELESIKARRTEEIKSIARDCKQHIVDLVLVEEGFGTMPDAEQFAECDKRLQKYMQTGDVGAVCGVNKKDIIQLSRRLKSFIEEKERRRDQLAKTGTEIARLWTLLRVPSVEREQFQASFQMNLSMQTLSRGMDELERLKDIRVKSIGRVIASIRSDILTLWEEAGIESDDNRYREFPLYFEATDRLEDAAVDLHEAYFTALRVRVEELKPILQKVSRRENVVQERVELEHIQMNPERLTARGPNAREERKREETMSSRVKNLEKYTKELVAAVQQWEEVNGPFMYGGERYFERIAHQEESYLEIRDSLRNARKKKDGKTEMLMPPGKASMLLKTKCGTPGHPGSSMKSKAHPELCLNDVNIALLNQQLNAAHGAHSAATATIDRLANAENINPASRVSAASHNSDETTCTTATEVRERPSTATLVKGNYV